MRSLAISIGTLFDDKFMVSVIPLKFRPDKAGIASFEGYLIEIKLNGNQHAKITILPTNISVRTQTRRFNVEYYNPDMLDIIKKAVYDGIKVEPCDTSTSGIGSYS